MLKRILAKIFRMIRCRVDGHAYEKNHLRKVREAGPTYFCRRCGHPKPVRFLHRVE